MGLLCFENRRRIPGLLKKRVVSGLITFVFCLMFFVQCKSDSASKEQSKPDTSTKSNTIAVFVDNGTYENLKTEIDRYIEDVKRDIDAEIKLYNQDFAKAEEIRNILMGLFKSDKLIGSVLIGNLPTATYEYYTNIYTGFYDLPTDWFYMMLEEDCVKDLDGDGKYEVEQMPYWQKPPDKFPWTGRIKGYNSDYSLLKRYFDRNHEYRTGGLKTDPTIFIYSMGKSGPTHDDKDIYHKNLKDNYERSSNLYLRENMVVQSEETAGPFFNELKKYHETAVVHCHGWHKIQNLLHSTDGDYVRPADLLANPPGALFYYQVSCGTGAFTVEDYLAGHYMFNGRGLVCFAYTTAGVMKGFDDSYGFFPYLEKGQNFGEAYKSFISEGTHHSDGGKVYGKWDLTTTLLGDPTLKMRR